MSALSSGASAKSLVPGDAHALRSFVQSFDGLGGGLQDAARQLRAIESGAWQGTAGDAFRDLLVDQPRRFDRGAEAFTAARSACLTYATELEHAQLLASRARLRYDEAAESTARWQTRSAAFRDLQSRAAAGEVAAVAALTRSPVPTAADPGAIGRAEAERMLAAARADVVAAAARAAAKLDAASRGAPKRPGILKRIARWGSEFGGGFVESVRGMGEFVSTYSATRLLLDPAGWSKDVVAMGRGLRYGVEHPVDFGKVLLDWETWQESPARAIGHLGPDALMVLATAGSSAAATRGMRASAAMTKAAKVADTVDGVTTGSGVAGAGEQLDDLKKKRAAACAK